MSCIRLRPSFATAFLLAMFSLISLRQNADSQDSSSSSSSISPKAADNSSVSAGAINNGVYRNSFFGFACKIPAGWVLRTDEMNTQDRQANPARPEETNRADRTAEAGCPHTETCGRVLLAAFSRPPQAQGEDVNSSILIAAESVTAYPGLKDAAQYFGPVTEVAKAQGFEVDEEPYELTVGTKNLVRGDFEKDVGTRVMHQSTLVMLDHGYALSFTFIAGTEDEVDDLVGNLSLSHPPAR
ncbi:MAG: hypothetical protein WCF22_07280 [Candidatus Sulfotelmatobacter sp.]